MSGGIRKRFDALARRGERALVPYWMSGFPDRRSFLAIARRILEEADVMEIGVPFSDPLADGPIIQAAGMQALQGGACLARTLEDVAQLSQEFPDRPLLLMSYVNPLRCYGWRRAARESRLAGVSGWIVPDLDLERREEVGAPAASAGIDLIPLVAPTSPDERLARVVQGGPAFVYLVSMTGVTGTRGASRVSVDRYVRRVRRHTDAPLCVGFGISNRAQARAAAHLSQGVIVGSALIEPFLREPPRKARQVLDARLQDIRRGLRDAARPPA